MEKPGHIHAQWDQFVWRGNDKDALKHVQSENIQIQFFCKISFAKTCPLVIKKIKKSNHIRIIRTDCSQDRGLFVGRILPVNPQPLSVLQAIRSELMDREHLVVSTLDQARTFLADQPIEGPGEPRKNLQPKTGTLQPVFYAFVSFLSGLDPQSGHTSDQSSRGRC